MQTTTQMSDRELLERVFAGLIVINRKLDRLEANVKFLADSSEEDTSEANSKFYSRHSESFERSYLTFDIHVKDCLRVMETGVSEEDL